jgi:hypothetical protein
MVRGSFGEDLLEWTPFSRQPVKPLKIIKRGKLKMKARRKFTKEFKQTAVRRLNSGQNMAEVVRAYGGASQ